MADTVIKDKPPIQIHLFKSRWKTGILVNSIIYLLEKKAFDLMVLFIKVGNHTTVGQTER